MASSSSSLVFRLFGEDVSASRELRKVGAEAEGLGSKFGALGGMAGSALAGIAIAAGAVGAASVKMAMDFDQQMARLQTQAHVPAAAIKGLSDQVLNLAGQVGIGPTSLAEALYHVESSFASTGISGQKAMDILKAAAEGARIGGSDLVDTQNALDAAVVSGIKGVQDYQQAMGALNATVGAGDMSMQDLADALGTGVLAVVKNYGVTLQDASAALATFGDNNIRGADAGTAFRMAVQSLAVPAQKGADLLGKIGLNAHSLAVDMQQGGLNKAMQDLNKHLQDAGITGSKLGDFLTETFGKKAGVGLAVLMGQFDRFESKYAEADKGAKQFADDWKAQQQQFSQVLKQLEAGAEAVGIRIGNFLIPKIMAFGKAVGDAWHSLNQQAGGQQSILKEFLTGFNNPHMTNFDSGFGGALERIGTAAHKTRDEVSKLWGEFLQHLKPFLHDAWDFITNSLLPALGNLWTALDPTVHRALHDLGQAFSDLGGFIKNDAGPWLESITKWMANHKQVVHDFADVTITLMTAWAGYTVWVKANAAAQTLTASIEALKAAASTPGGKIAWVAGISLGLYFLYRDVDTFRHGLEGFAGDMAGVFGGIMVAFKGMADGIFSGTSGILHVLSLVPGPQQKALRHARDSIDEFKRSFDGNIGGAIRDTDSFKNHMYDLSKGIHDGTTTNITDLGTLKKSVEGLPNHDIVVNVIDNASAILGDIHHAAADLISLGFTPQGATNTVKASHLADGGPVVGPGGPREDRVPIMASNGEFVVNAAATSRNLPLLHAINAQRFADGGLIDRLTYDATPTVQNMGNILHSGFSGGGGGGGPGGMSSGAAVALGRVMAAAYGWVGPMFDALNKLWTRESGWNPNAVNPSSGAYGIPQALGHGHPFNLGDDSGQIAWGLQYIAGRYGNPMAAWAHETAVGWYGKGGRIPAGAWGIAGEAGAELIEGPATVYSNAQSQKMLGGTHVHIHGGTFIGTNLDKAADDMMVAIDRRVARGGAVPATFRRR